MIANSPPEVHPSSRTAKVWIRLTEPSISIREPDLRRRARLLSSILIVLIPVSAIMTLLIPLIGSSSLLSRAGWQLYFPSFTAAFLLIGVYVLSRTRYYRLTAVITIAIISATVYILQIFNPDATSLPYFLILGVFLSGLLLSLRTTFLLLVTTLVAFGLLRLFVPTMDAVGLYNAICFITLAGGLILIAARSLEEDLKQIEQQSQELSRREKRFRVLIENDSDVVLLLNEMGKILFTSPSSSRITGYSSEDHIGRNLFELIHPDDLQSARELFARLLQERAAITISNLRNRHKDGSWRRIEGIATNLLHETDVKAIVFNYRDITERKLVEAALQESEKRYRGLFENSPVSLWEEDFSAIKRRLDDLSKLGVTDIPDYFESHPEMVSEWAKEVRILDVNNATLKLYKAGSKADLLVNLGQIFNDESHVAFREELEYIAEGKHEFEWEGVNLTLTGNELVVSLHWSVAPGYEESLGRVIVSVTDITERKRAVEKLEYIGTHDALTDLYNRSHFNSELERLQQGRQFPVSVVLVDVDDMKSINDSYGHAAGDAFLKRTARLLMASFRNDDIVARIGGDEFAVLLPQTKAALANQKIRHIKNMLSLHNKDFSGIALSLSIGTATEEKGVSMDEILKVADDNMYREKQAKRETGGGRLEIRD
jgi:diguanylate cyclase (GGDEF)-like protein/PAS domain S-box-containing protein